MSDPSAGSTIPLKGGMKDSRWPASSGWVKMRQNVNGVEVHYVRNTRTGESRRFQVSRLDMRVLCKANNGNSLSAKHFEAGNTPSSEFDLEIGKEYVVYGINLWKGLLGYLIIGEGLFPHWYPSELFTVTQNEIPPDWFFAQFNDEKGFDLNAVWGYHELVNSEDHYDELANLEKKALDVFVEKMEKIKEIS